MTDEERLVDAAGRWWRLCERRGARASGRRTRSVMITARARRGASRAEGVNTYSRPSPVYAVRSILYFWKEVRWVVGDGPPRSAMRRPSARTGPCERRRWSAPQRNGMKPDVILVIPL